MANIEIARVCNSYTVRKRIKYHVIMGTKNKRRWGRTVLTLFLMLFSLMGIVLYETRNNIIDWIFRQYGSHNIPRDYYEFGLFAGFGFLFIVSLALLAICMDDFDDNMDLQ